MPRIVKVNEKCDRAVSHKHRGLALSGAHEIVGVGVTRDMKENHVGNCSFLDPHSSQTCLLPFSTLLGTLTFFLCLESFRQSAFYFDLPTPKGA